MSARAVILSAVRTPVGRYGGALAGVRPDDLAAIAVRAAVDRAGVPEGEIEDVWLGCANQAGEDNRNVARMAVLLAGLAGLRRRRDRQPAVRVGLAAIVGACHAVVAGDGDLFVAGGVESMTRAPLVTAKPEPPFPRGDRELYDTTLGWRFPNPRLEEQFPLEAMGETGENVAERWDVSREVQDAFALRSQQRWAAAAEAGRFDDELVPVGDFARDEHPRPDTSAEKLAALRPAFRPGGTVTAGNSSGLNDGAAAVVVASEDESARARHRSRSARSSRLGGRGRRPARDGHRAGAGGAQAARARGPDGRRSRPGRAERGVRVAVARGRPRARARRGPGERERRRDRDRPSARHERRAADRHAAARAAPPRRPLRRRDDVRRRRPGPGGAVRAERSEPRRALPRARAAARQARRRPRRLLLRAARAASSRSTPRRPSTPRSSPPTRDALLAELDDGWLRDQVRGCATYAHVLAGRRALLRRRGRGLLRRPPERTPTSVYEAAHAELDELLPGDGSLSSAARRGATQHLVDGAIAVPCCGTCSRCCASAPRRSSSCPPGEQPSSSRSATSRGGRSTTTSATCAAASS